MGETTIRWLCIVIIVFIIMVGLFKTTEMAFDRMERIQEKSMQVIEK